VRLCGAAGVPQTFALLSRRGKAEADVRQYYDGMGRLTRESQAIKGGTARTIDSLYDKAGTRTKLTYPAGKEVVFTYDALARVSTIADGANERAVYKYRGSSRLSQKALKNGANTVSTLKVGYDGLGRVTSWFYRNAADDATIVGFQHDYDKVGNPKYEVRVHQGNYGDAYSYDGLYRLTGSVQGFSHFPSWVLLELVCTSPCCEPRGASSKGCSSLSRQPRSPPSPALAGAPC